MNRLLLPALALLVAFLGLECWQAWNEPEAADLPAAAASSVPTADNAFVPSSDVALAAAVAQITARPLLRPDRAPFREIPAVSAVPQRNYDGELGRFTLIGILPIDGKEKALVVRKGPVATERWELAEGDPLPGFTVRLIRPDGVLLSADGRDFLLPLYAGGPKQSGGLRTETPSPAPVSAPQPVPAAQPAPRGIAVPPPVPAVSPIPQPGSPYPPAVPGNVRNRARILPPRPSMPPAGPQR
jgi:hypothetical protein